MDARHLEVLTRMVRPRRALEIGTLFGYSTWAILQGVDPEKGCLWTLEKSEKHASVARESLEWALKAHLAKAPDVKLAEHRIVTGPALQSLATLEGEGPFDFVFIDADKAGYAAYWNWCQSHVRQGGVVVADNTFVWGLIADDPERLDEPDRRAVLALREFNRQISQNTNWNTTFLPTAEGLSISVRL
jgi:caffeoyl-CoA O-methyltransferase